MIKLQCCLLFVANAPIYPTQQTIITIIASYSTALKRGKLWKAQRFRTIEWKPSLKKKKIKKNNEREKGLKCSIFNIFDLQSHTKYQDKCINTLNMRPHFIRRRNHLSQFDEIINSNFANFHAIGMWYVVWVFGVFVVFVVFGMHLYLFWMVYVNRSDYHSSK